MQQSVGWLWEAKPERFIAKCKRLHLLVYKTSFCDCTPIAALCQRRRISDQLIRPSRLILHCFFDFDSAKPNCKIPLTRIHLKNEKKKKHVKFEIKFFLYIYSFFHLFSKQQQEFRHSDPAFHHIIIRYGQYDHKIIVTKY